MPQSVYPLTQKIDTSTPLDVTDTQAQTTREEILEVGERVNTHLTTVSGLDLEKGES